MIKRVAEMKRLHAANECTSGHSCLPAGISLPQPVEVVEERCVRPASTPTKTRGSRTVRYHRGYKYTRNWGSKRKTVYRCSGFRNTKCEATLELRMPDPLVSVGTHTCPPPVSAKGHTVSVAVAMKEMTDRLATSELGMSATDIWKKVCTTFYSADDDRVVEGLTEEQVVSRVFRFKRRYFGGELHGVVEVAPLSMVPRTKLSFFQFHLVTPNKKANAKTNRLIGWAHPALMETLSAHSVTLFVDGTFRCVPKGFHQRVVVMAEDRARCLFVPVYYEPCSNRSEETYWELLDQIIKSTDNNLQPAEVVFDFELGLIKGVQAQYPNAVVIACLFHFKQALRRKMKKLQIPDREVSVAMARGVLDILTVIEQDKVEGVGIAWVKAEIKARCNRLGHHYSKQSGDRSGHTSGRHGWSDILCKNGMLSDMPTFVRTIREISVDYVRKQLHTTIGLRRRAQRSLPSFELPASVDLSNVDPADSDDGASGDEGDNGSSVANDDLDDTHSNASDDSDDDSSEGDDTLDDFSFEFDGDACSSSGGGLAGFLEVVV